MFGDSVDPSPTGSVLSASPSSSSSVASNNAAEELASLYHATRNGGRLPPKTGGGGGGPNKKYDSVTVEQIKAQFQKQIEAMLQSQERHETTPASAALNKRPPPPPSALLDTNRVKLQVPSPPRPHPKNHQQQQQHPGLRSSHLPGPAERELTGIRDLQRGKSFAEARTAVQKHIEKMFNGADGAAGETNLHGRPIKHTMHGVSHRRPGEDEEDIEPPPPTHYGVRQVSRELFI